MLSLRSTRARTDGVQSVLCLWTELFRPLWTHQRSTDVLLM